MKRLIKLMSAVLTITLLAGALVFPGAAWEYTVSPWAVAELTEAVELGLQNKDFYQKYDGKSSLHWSGDRESGGGGRDSGAPVCGGIYGGRDPGRSSV